MTPKQQKNSTVIFVILALIVLSIVKPAETLSEGLVRASVVALFSVIVFNVVIWRIWPARNTSSWAKKLVARNLKSPFAPHESVVSVEGVYRVDGSKTDDWNVTTVSHGNQYLYRVRGDGIVIYRGPILPSYADL